MGISFNPTIDLSAVIAVFGYIFVACSLYYAITGEIKLLGHRMGLVEEQTKQVATILTTMATEKLRIDLQGQRMNELERRINELAHGEGFVMPLMKARKIIE